MNSQTTQTSERKPIVLFVDDYGGLLESYRGVAEDEGYEVITAISAQEALQHRNKEFDIAIFDGLGERCFDLYEKINAKRKIILSGDNNILKEAKKRGYENYSKYSRFNLYDLLSR